MNTDSYAHVFAVFFFNDTATTEIYTLSLHDALPISETRVWGWSGERRGAHRGRSGVVGGDRDTGLGLPDARRPGAARSGGARLGGRGGGPRRPAAAGSRRGVRRLGRVRPEPGRGFRAGRAARRRRAR